MKGRYIALNKTLMSLMALACTAMLFGLTVMAGSEGKGQYQGNFGLHANGDGVEQRYMFEDQGSALADGWRFADGTGYWTYYFKFEDTLTSLNIDFDIAGQYLIDVSVDGQKWIGIGSVEEVGERTLLRTNLTPLVRSKWDCIFIRFSDKVPSDGFGTSLWSLDMDYSLQNGMVGSMPTGPENGSITANSVHFTADGSSDERMYLFKDNGSGVMEDHRFADEGSYWVYYFRFSDAVAEAVLSLDLGGQYKVSISNNNREWTTLFSSLVFKERNTVEADLTKWLADGSTTVYLKFEDANIQDGFGSSLWNLAMRYKLASAQAEQRPSGPIVNSLAFATLGGAVESRFMLSNNGSAIDAKNGYRYADWETSWIYGFSFYDEVVSAAFRLETGGEYRISLSTDGVRWTDMSVAEGRPDQETIGIDASQLLGEGARTIYVKFADRDTQSGFGVRLRQIRLEYMLKGGQPDTGPSAIR